MRKTTLPLPLFFNLYNLRNIPDPGPTAARLPAKLGINLVGEDTGELKQARFAVKRVGSARHSNIIRGGALGNNRTWNS